MKNLTLGIRIPPCRPAPEMADYLRRIESAGFDFAGLTDSQLLGRDVFVTMALAAQRTSRLKLYTAVTNPVTRHISVLAGASLTVHEIAPGRIGVIIGSGYSATQTIGRKAATVAQMRDAVLTLKRLFAREKVQFNGARSHLHFSHGGGPPVYIAATGPRTIELAGEVADGVLLAAGVHPAILKAARRHLAAGAARAGRSAQDVDVMLYARTLLDRDMAAARLMARPLCAEWVIEDYRAHWLREAGLDIPTYDRLPPELLELYPDIIHAEDWEAAKRATAFLSDELVAQICDAVGFIGTPEHCARRLQEVAQAGERHIYLMTLDTYIFPEKTVSLYEEQVLPRLGR